MIDFIYNYVFISIITILCISFVRGFNGKQCNKQDIIESVFWPITFTVILGTIIRVLVDYIIQKFSKKEVDE